MSPCSNLVFLTTLACQLTECLSTDELNILGANLTALGDMLVAAATQAEICQSDKDRDNPHDKCTPQA